MRVLRAREYRRVLWKNGAGETVEVVSSPEGAPMDDFGWRISIAKVPDSGPFSTFPGVDRTLAVLHGRIVLHVEGQPDMFITADSHPCTFAGDVPTSATVIEPVTNLNVMTRRRCWTATLKRFERLVRFQPENETLLLLREDAVYATGEILLTNDVLWLGAEECATFLTPVALAWAIAFRRP